MTTNAVATTTDVTAVWVAAIAAAAALAGAAIGVVGGFLVARQNNDAQLKSVREARREERRSAAYLELAIGWNLWLQTIRQVASPGEGFTNRLPPENVLLRARVQLALFGSAAVLDLHDRAYECLEAITSLLTGLPKTPTGEAIVTPESQGLLVVALADAGAAVDALERQMNRELHPGGG